MKQPSIRIIGAGPSGLYCALYLLKAGFTVDLYDQMSGPLKKFLIAGHSGLNITHGEDIQLFKTRYQSEDPEFFSDLIDNFPPDKMRDFYKELGADSFIGTSGRVFPTEMKAGKILLSWMSKLNSFPNFTFHKKHKFTKLTSDGAIRFRTLESEIDLPTGTNIFALGGGSYSKTGSDGQWISIFNNLSINSSKLMPSNCGYLYQWTELFLDKFEISPLKNVTIEITGRPKIRCEILITQYGVEGQGIYSYGQYIRDEILKNGVATLKVDLKPDLTIKEIETKLNRPRGKNSLSNHIRKCLGLKGTSISLIREFSSAQEMQNTQFLAKLVKNLEIKLTTARPIDEAISTAGGISLSEINNSLELNKVKKSYVCGEMLDWDAPTGGYLLQACFAMAHKLCQDIVKS